MKFLFSVIIGLLLISNKNVQAQTNNKCVFNTPVFTVRFGTLFDYNEPMMYNLNNYQAATGHCPAKGFYGYAADLENCNSAKWHALPEDHTPGDRFGKMMLVHTGEKAGSFFKMSLSGLKSGATYRFNAWFINICKPDACGKAAPVVEISLYANDKLLSSFKTSGLEAVAAPAWKNQSAEFVMAPGTDVLTIQMNNLSTGDCVNDFALDDIEINQCSIPVTPPPPLPETKPEVKVFDTPVPNALETRDNPVVKKITTEETEISIELYDNGEVDGDTVSIYHNNKLVVSHAGISTKAVALKIKVDKANPHHELVMVADNLGRIPPNTSLMIVTAGKKRYEIFISSSEQKNAKVIIDLQ